MAESKEDKPEHHIHHDKPSLMESVRKNPWIVATVFLALVLVIGLAVNAFSGISKDEAAKRLLTFYSGQGISGLTVNSTEKVSGMYRVTFNYQGQTVPMYMTTDGKMVGSMDVFKGATSSTSSNTQTQTTAPKSDKPDVTLYVFSYCPYGLQAEKGFIPVYNLLKNKANIEIKFIGAMHGKYEETESLRQLCIESKYGKDQFMAYALKFSADTAIGACSSDASCAKPLAEKIITSLGMNVNTINTCMASTEVQSLYEADQADASQNGISGSPSLVINGVSVQSGRDSASYLNTICSAFTTEPTECSQTVSSTSPSAGFGSSAGTATGASC